MSLALRFNRNNAASTRDPLAVAREMLSWDPWNTRTVSAFSPSFEVKETADSFVVRADVPGVKDEDIDISLHNNVLNISGVRNAEERKEDDSYFLYERQYGSFSRSFALPEAADGEKVEAKIDGGVLTLTIGKKVSASPRKIALKKA